ncbi:hypothetical protein BDV18DRAFT_142729 [Aspergillus unguis]
MFEHQVTPTTTALNLRRNTARLSRESNALERLNLVRQYDLPSYGHNLERLQELEVDYAY